MKIARTSTTSPVKGQVALALAGSIPQILDIGMEVVKGYNAREEIRECAHATVVTLAARREDARLIADTLDPSLTPECQLVLCQGLVETLNAPLHS